MCRRMTRRRDSIAQLGRRQAIGEAPQRLLVAGGVEAVDRRHVDGAASQTPCSRSTVATSSSPKRRRRRAEAMRGERAAQLGEQLVVDGGVAVEAVLALDVEALHHAQRDPAAPATSRSRSCG